MKSCEKTVATVDPCASSFLLTLAPLTLRAREKLSDTDYRREVRGIMLTLVLFSLVVIARRINFDRISVNSEFVRSSEWLSLSI